MCLCTRVHIRALDLLVRFFVVFAVKAPRRSRDSLLSKADASARRSAPHSVTSLPVVSSPSAVRFDCLPLPSPLLLSLQMSSQIGAVGSAAGARTARTAAAALQRVLAASASAAVAASVGTRRALHTLAAAAQLHTATRVALAASSGCVRGGRWAPAAAPALSFQSAGRRPLSSSSAATLEPQLVALLQAAAVAAQGDKHEQHMHMHTSAINHSQQSATQSNTAAPAPGPSGGSGSSGSTSGSGSGGGSGGAHPPLDGGDHSSTYSRQVREISAALTNLHLSSRVSWSKIVMALGAVTGVAGLLIYIFRDPLKANLSEQTADVAKRSLNSTEVQTQVNVLSADVVQGLLNNPAVMAQSQAFLTRLMAAPDTRANLVTLLQATANDPETLALMSKFSAALLADLASRPDTLAQLTNLLRSAITNPGNEQALQVLFKSFAAEPNTQRMVADLARAAALDVLNDDAVKEAAKQFLKDVTADTAVQKSTGDALWNAVKFSLKPSWLGRSGHGHQTPGEIIAEAEANMTADAAAAAAAEAVTADAPVVAALAPEGSVVVTPVVQIVPPTPMPAPEEESTLSAPAPNSATSQLAAVDVQTAEMAAQSADSNTQAATQTTPSTEVTPPESTPPAA